MPSFLRRLYATYVTELRDQVDAECAEHRAKTSPAEVTRRLAIVFFGAAVCMLLVRFCGNVDDPKWVRSLLQPIGLGKLAGQFEHAMTKSPDKRINQRIWWAVARIVAYLIVPMAIVKLGLRAKLRDTGLGLGGRSGWKIYGTLLALVAPLVIWVSFSPAFQSKYPYYRLAPGEPLWPSFVVWELLYATQFLGIEYFFRGFFVHGLRRELGYAAVFAPVVPYVTIHFGKPLPEALGSLVTGFLLGTLSLKTRSVWGAWGVHATVACSMDLLSLWHQGLI